MENKETKKIASSLKAVKYILDNLLADCGGAEAEGLLQKLSELKPSLRSKALKCFTLALEAAKSEEVISKSEKEFEDELFNSIVSELEKKSQPKFSVSQASAQVLAPKELSAAKISVAASNFKILDGGLGLRGKGNVLSFPNTEKRA